MKVNKRCPKCKGKNLELIEVWEGHTITWQVEDGQINRNEGNIEPGDPWKVEGHCEDCDHRWTFRKTLQIEDLNSEL